MIKPKINIFIGIAIFLTTHNCYSQSSLSQQFHSFFKEVKFDVLHVYSFSRIESKFQQSSTYPYKGVELDYSYHKLFNNIISKKKIESSTFYATYRFNISDQLDALLIREFIETGMEHHIHYMIYNKLKNELIKAVELSYSYDYEGNNGGMESWIIDLNSDGKLDILTRSIHQSLLNMNMEEVLDKKVNVSIWKEDKLILNEITDTLLIKQIEVNFPYYKKTTLSNIIKKRLEIFLNENENINKTNELLAKWCIVIGSDKDLQSAEYEKKQALKTFKTNQRNGLNYNHFKIYKKNNRFYTIINDFKSKTEAENVLINVKKRFNETAYLINLNKWCLESEYQKKGFKECVK